MGTPEEVIEFLDAFFNGTDGFIEFRLLKKTEEGRKTQSFFYQSTDDIYWKRLLAENKNGRNISFGPNTRKRRKGKKEDVYEVTALHVDLDGDDFPGGKEAILPYIRKVLPEHLQPSIIVDSGHGYHLYWLLREPYLIENDDDIAIIEGYNKGLAQHLCGDSAHDISHVLRLPETINQKDSKHPVPCRVIHFNPERRFDPTDFDDFWTKSTPKSLQEISFSGNPTHVELNELKVSPHIKDLIVNGQGQHERYHSRSEADQAVITALLSAGHTPDTIRAVFANKEWRIGDKYRESGDPYLKHSISNATAFLQSRNDAGSPVNDEDEPGIHLIEIEDANHLGKRVLTELTVVGVGEVYFVPKRIRGICKSVNKEDMCSSCPLQKEPEMIKEMNPNNPDLIDCTEISTSRKSKILKSVFRIPDGCNAHVLEQVEAQPLTEFIAFPHAQGIRSDPAGRLIDTLGREFRKKQVFYLGKKQSTVQSYKATGTVVANPKSQKSTLLIHTLEPIGAIENTPEPVAISIEELHDMIDSMKGITRLYGREDAVTATILVFASPIAFYFDGSLQKGWMEIAHIGDSRTGKSQHASQLQSTLGLGFLAVGESASRTGLLYSIENLSKGRTLQWGLIAQQDGGLLVIDGCGDIPPQEWQQAREARSQGVIRVNRAVHGEHPSRTRLILIGNSPAPLATYNHPVEALPQLFLSPDIARLDLVVFFEDTDVDLEDINQQMEDFEVDISPLRSNILHAWKIEPNALTFSDEAQNAIYEKATSLGRKFGSRGSHEIPLVGNDFKIKLARLSMACALLCGKTTVSVEHVTFIEALIERIYCKGKLDKFVIAKRKELQGGDVEEIQQMATWLNSQMREDTILEQIVKKFKTIDRISLKDLALKTEFSRKTVRLRTDELRGRGLLIPTGQGLKKTALFREVIKRIEERNYAQQPSN